MIATAMATTSLSICGEHSDAKEYLDTISNYNRKTMSERNPGSDLDESLWCKLDDDLLEKIIGRLDFQSLFQAASLSKAWRLRFCSPSFQSEVQSSSASWKSYAPVFLSVEKELMGYESSSNRWHKLPSHDILQLDHYRHMDCWLQASHGSLLCWTFWNLNQVEYLITNPLTKTWKRLHLLPNTPPAELVHIVCEGSTGYKLTLGAQFGCGITVQIFDSIKDSWVEGSYDTGLKRFKLGRWAYVNGVFYIPVHRLEYGRPVYDLISLDAKQMIWKKISVDLKQNIVVPNFLYVNRFDIIVCGSNMMLAIHHTQDDGSAFDSYIGMTHDEIVWQNTLSVFRLDLESGVAWEVSRAETWMLNKNGFPSAAGQDGSIYFGWRDIPYHLIVYNVGSKEWHQVPVAAELNHLLDDSRFFGWKQTSISYQPGLNPFFTV